MSRVAEEVRRLVSHQGEHRVISLFLDLDPERFATPPARASQIRSLLDEASREIEGLELGHEEKVALREDLERVEDFLCSPGAPFKGTRSLAVFCASRDGLFETVALTRPVSARVVIEAAPYVEPMIEALAQKRWLVALVNRRSGRILTGSPERLRERRRVEDDVHGQHEKGGWSQANYERSVDKDALDHLRGVAEIVNRRCQRERFDRVALGGPQEVVARFRELLAQDVRGRLAAQRVDVDLASASEPQVRSAVEGIVLEDERQSEAEALERLRAGVGAGGRAVHGVADTTKALGERRVQTLVLAGDFDARSERCPSCGILVADGNARCPADDTELEPVDHLREAVVEEAIAQDAEVLVVRHRPEDGPKGGIGAILRF